VSILFEVDTEMTAKLLLPAAFIAHPQVVREQAGGQFDRYCESLPELSGFVECRRFHHRMTAD